MLVATLLILALSANTTDKSPLEEDIASKEAEQGAVSTTSTSTAVPAPTPAPTLEPTMQPTMQPTVEPTMQPTVEPTMQPTMQPTVEPTAAPTPAPTAPVMLPASLADGPRLGWTSDLSPGHLLCLEQTLNSALPDVHLTNDEADLTFVFSDQTDEDLCKYTTYAAETSAEAIDKFQAQCEAFCGNEGSMIAAVIGSDQYGMNLREMHEICLSPEGLFPLGANRELQTQCSRAADDVTAVQANTAKVVAALEEFVYDKFVFSARMDEGRKLLKDAVTDPELLRHFERQADSEKPRAVTQQIRQVLQSQAFNAPKREIMASLDRVAERLDFHFGQLRDNLQSFRFITEECSGTFAGVGPSNEFLLDFCAQGSTECIEAEEGEHVGCCCGFSPMASITRGFGGATIAGRGALDRRLGELTRELAEGRSAELLVAADICTTAGQLAAPRIQEAKASLDAMDKQGVYENYETALRIKYQDFFEMQCSETLDEVAAALACERETGEACEWFDCYDGAGVCVDGKCVCETGSCARDGVCVPACTEAPARLLAEPLEPERGAKHLLCEEPELTLASGVSYLAALSPVAERDICRHMPETQTDAQMMEMCGAFCGADAIPFLLGSTSYGFNLDSAAGICSAVAPPYPEWKERDCLRKLQSFAPIQEGIIEFVEACLRFATVQLRYEAELQDRQAKVVAHLKSKGFMDQLARSVDKTAFYLEEVRQVLFEETGGRAPFYLQQAMELMERHAGHIEKVVSERLPDFRSFVTECTDITIAGSAEGHALLDICSQGNDLCVEEERAEHVTCCCGINRALWLGTNQTAPQTIPGKAGLARHLEAGPRRLAEASLLDTCGEAYERALPQLEEQRAHIRRTAYGTALLADYERRKAPAECASFELPACAVTSAAFVLGLLALA